MIIPGQRRGSTLTRAPAGIDNEGLLSVILAAAEPTGPDSGSVLEPSLGPKASSRSRLVIGPGSKLVRASSCSTRRALSTASIIGITRKSAAFATSNFFEISVQHTGHFRLYWSACKKLVTLNSGIILNRSYYTVSAHSLQKVWPQASITGSTNRSRQTEHVTSFRRAVQCEARSPRDVMTKAAQKHEASIFRCHF